MTAPAIPADVADVLRQAARAEPSGLPGKASDLCTKYGINLEPETLANHGTITYTRRFRHETGWEKVEEATRDSDREDEGLHVRRDGEPLESTRLVPWPDDGGICDLLNDGWRLIPTDELQRGVHEVFDPRDNSEGWFDEAITDIACTNWTHLVVAREVSR